MITVKVNATECLKALTAISKRYERAILKEALNFAGDVLLERTKELAPDETGVLQEALDKQVIVKRGKGEVRVGPKHLIEEVTPPDRRTPQQRSPSFDAPPDIDHRGYEVFMEYGTEHSPSQSFIRRALDERGDRAIELAAQILEQGLKQDVT